MHFKTRLHVSCVDLGIFLILDRSEPLSRDPTVVIGLIAL